MTTPIRFGRLALAQLTDHYEGHLRPHLEGLSDDEYFFEPVAGCWSIRQRADARSPMAAGAGEMVADFELPEPDPAPFTTIAWRLAHVTVGVFAMRNAWHGGLLLCERSLPAPGTLGTTARRSGRLRQIARRARRRGLPGRARAPQLHLHGLTRYLRRRRVQ